MLAMIGLVALCSWSVAQAPEILNSEIAIEQVGPSLSSSVDSLLNRGSGLRWIAWSVPALAGHRFLCCRDRREELSQGAACALGSRDRQFVMSEAYDSGRPPETPRITILLRAEESRVEEVRVYSQACRLDAGGRPVTWLEPVSAEQSADWLTTLVGEVAGDGDRDDLADESLLALALHKGETVNRELSAFAAAGPTTAVREEAIFWLGEARGAAGLEALDRLLESERDPGIKTHIAFALTLSSATGAVARLKALAHQDPDPEVRGQALFWLAQEGGEMAVAALQAAIDSDPDPEVRQEAIFALGQVPDGKGIDGLLAIVQDASQAASVRQEALFWLVQSEDERALDLITEILRR
jgi:hypothetical protein